MLPAALPFLQDTAPVAPRGDTRVRQEWVVQGVCAQFEDGAVSVCTAQPLAVRGKYGVLTIDAEGGYSYALHKGIGEGRDAFVYVGVEPCVYTVEPLWFATEVFRISNPLSGPADNHQVAVSIAIG